MEIQESNNNITFLGNPLFIHKNKTNQFNKILEILAQKIEGWRANFLSHVGNATLIRSILQSTPMYIMSVFKVPKTIC